MRCWSVKFLICFSCSVRQVTVPPGPDRWRLRYLAYGPITDTPPSDQHKIAELIQRGRAVTDERLIAQALACARFRARVCGLIGLIVLLFGAADLAGSLVSGSAVHHLLLALATLGFALMAAAWLWQANRCLPG